MILTNDHCQKWQSCLRRDQKDHQWLRERQIYQTWGAYKIFVATKVFNLYFLRKLSLFKPMQCVWRITFYCMVKVRQQRKWWRRWVLRRRSGRSTQNQRYLISPVRCSRRRLFRCGVRAVLSENISYNSDEWWRSSFRSEMDLTPVICSLCWTQSAKDGLLIRKGIDKSKESETSKIESNCQYQDQCPGGADLKIHFHTLPRSKENLRGRIPWHPGHPSSQTATLAKISYSARFTSSFLKSVLSSCWQLENADDLIMFFEKRVRPRLMDYFGHQFENGLIWSESLINLSSYLTMITRNNDHRRLQ